MPLLAVCLVVTAAFTHATWNLLAKKASGTRHFVWFYSVGSVLVFLPAAWYALATQGLSGRPIQLVFLVVSASLHLLYSQSLQRGYQSGELSVVYPIARGTGPLLSFLGAILVLGERPSWVASLGALAVVAGVFTIAEGTRLRVPGRHRRGAAWGLVVGTLIASYTLTDGYSVRELALSPILVDYSGNLFRAGALFPGVWRDRENARFEYRRNWRSALAVSVLGPTGYILVLFAMKLAPVSQVAPARELSMTVGAYFGARLLGEKNARTRIAASLVIVAGVVALALG